MAGAEVVDGDGDAEVLEAAECGQRLVGVPDQGLLGDLHGEVSWLEVAVAQDPRDRGHEVQGDQLSGRHVDAESEPRVLLVPRGELPAPGLDHPAAQFAGL